MLCECDGLNIYRECLACKELCNLPEGCALYVSITTRKCDKARTSIARQCGCIGLTSASHANLQPCLRVIATGQARRGSNSSGGRRWCAGCRFHNGFTFANGLLTSCFLCTGLFVGLNLRLNIGTGFRILDLLCRTK